MIQEIEKIPQSTSARRESYREMIRNDIAEAIEKRIPKFELIGEYNYKYLANYAREEGGRYFRLKHYCPVALLVSNVLGEKYKEKYMRVYTPAGYELEKKFIKVHNVKGEDRNHVYVFLDFDFLDGLKEYVYQETEKKYLEHLKRRNGA